MNLLKIVYKNILFALILLGNVAYAQEQGSQIKFDPSWVQGQVLTDALAATKTLDKDYVVYHWVNRMYIAADSKNTFYKDSPIPAKGPFSSTDEKITAFAQKNMKDRMDIFWNITSRITGRNAEQKPMAPNGLYVAINPVISKQWGDTLYQMSLPQGMRFINGESYREFGSALKKALIERGCARIRVADLIKADTNEFACRKALAEIALATESSAVSYQFNTEPMPNCPRISPAFVLISPTALKPGFVVAMSPPYVPEVDDGLNNVRGIINGAFQLALSTGVLNHAPPFNLKSKELPVANENMIRQYSADHYFNCRFENRK